MHSPCVGPYGFQIDGTFFLKNVHEFMCFYVLSVDECRARLCFSIKIGPEKIVLHSSVIYYLNVQRKQNILLTNITNKKRITILHQGHSIS